ncbi:hypothetical protein D187_005116 [Cystobacter fuscus DSM 2262]|uniref:Uncharacterized protein n=1 Tax=Cystobacter fuscus (strain ATCC 25194 / DSM 2262 / NBRC 100088 / M29) TaxID=1242864 RepID=S9R4Y1_CYSF2|nr:hypothetical protein D187_005116 [Cystobacter fuscus DSM 2262]
MRAGEGVHRSCAGPRQPRIRNPHRIRRGPSPVGAIRSPVRPPHGKSTLRARAPPPGGATAHSWC